MSSGPGSSRVTHPISGRVHEGHNYFLTGVPFAEGSHKKVLMSVCQFSRASGSTLYTYNFVGDTLVSRLRDRILASKEYSLLYRRQPTYVLSSKHPGARSSEEPGLLDFRPLSPSVPTVHPHGGRVRASEDRGPVVSQLVPLFGRHWSPRDTLVVLLIDNIGQIIELLLE